MHHEVRSQADEAFVSLPHFEGQREAATEESLRRIRRRSRRSPTSLAINLALTAIAAAAAVFLVLQCSRVLRLGKGGEQLFTRGLAAAWETAECSEGGRAGTSGRGGPQHQSAMSGLVLQLERLTLDKEDEALLSRSERSHVEAARRKVERLSELVSMLESEVAALNERVITTEKQLDADLAAFPKGASIPEALTLAFRTLEKEKTRLLAQMVEQQEREAQLASMHYRFDQAVLTAFILAKKRSEGQSISVAAAAALAAAEAVDLGTQPIRGSGLLTSLSPAGRELLPSILTEMEQKAVELFKKLYLSFVKKDRTALSTQVKEAHVHVRDCEAIARAYVQTPLPMPSPAFERATQRLARKITRVSEFLREGESGRAGLESALASLALGAESPRTSAALGAAAAAESSSSEEGPESRQVAGPADPRVEMEATVGEMLAASEGTLFEKQRWMLELARPGDDSGLTPEDHEKVKRAKERLESLVKTEQELRTQVELLEKNLELDERVVNELMGELFSAGPVPKVYAQMQGDVDFVRKWLKETKDKLEQVRDEMRNASVGPFQQAHCVLISAQRRLTSGTPLAPLGAVVVGAAAVALGEISPATLPVPTEMEKKAIRVSLLEVSGRVRLRAMRLKRAAHTTKAKELRFARMVIEEASVLVTTAELLLGEVEEAAMIREAVQELQRVCEVSEVLVSTRQLTDVANVTRVLQPAQKAKVHPMQLEAVYVDRLHAVAAARTCDLTSSALSEAEKAVFQQALKMNADFLCTLQERLVSPWKHRCERLVSEVVGVAQEVREARASLDAASTPSPPSQGTLQRRPKKKAKQPTKHQGPEQRAERSLPSLLALAEDLVRAVERLQKVLSSVEAELIIFRDMERVMPFPAEVESEIKNVEHVARAEKTHANSASALLSQMLSSELSKLSRSHKKPSGAVGRRPSFLKEGGEARPPSLTEESEFGGLPLRAAARKAEELLVRLMKVGVDERSCEGLRALIDVVLGEESD
ncbi:hypothetical protein ACSSS7_004501 [Eimeria intestinalis]